MSIPSVGPFVTAQQAAAPTPATKSVGSAGNAELGQEAFLQLLVAQLKYQDPTAPVDSSQFMAQTAQFTSVEKLTALVEGQATAAASSQRLAAGALVGQQVSFVDDEGVSRTGSVKAVRFGGAEPILEVPVGTETWGIPLSSLSSVGAPADITRSQQNSGTQTA